MNPLLKNYCISVEFPDVSGAEHLEMLQIRDRLTTVESQLTEAEKVLLAQADQKLVDKAEDFYQELSKFINLPNKRKNESIHPEQWWWYLDAIQTVKAFFCSDIPVAIWVRESQNPQAIKVQQRLTTKGLPQIVVDLEKCLMISNEWDRLYHAQSILVGTSTSINTSQKGSYNSDQSVELLDLTESLLKQLIRLDSVAC